MLSICSLDAQPVVLDRFSVPCCAVSHTCGTDASAEHSVKLALSVADDAGLLVLCCVDDVMTVRDGCDSSSMVVRAADTGVFGWPRTWTMSALSMSPSSLLSRPVSA